MKARRLRISGSVFPKNSASESYNYYFFKALHWIFELVETPKTVSLSGGRLVKYIQKHHQFNISVKHFENIFIKTTYVR
jgi:hypothetical protein